MTDREQSDTVQLKLRLKEPDRAALERAAQGRGVSMNTEIVDRLRRSFDDDRSVSDIFGNRRDFALMKLIYSTIETISNLNKPDADWLEDPYRFDQAFKAVTAIFESIRPPGAVPEGAEAHDRGGQKRGLGAAFMALDEVMRANPGAAFDEKEHKLRAATLATDLGKLATEARLPGKTVAKIADELLPYVEQARAEGVSPLEIYRRTRNEAAGDAPARP
ncbi:hypothetical protein [Methylobacterium nigriterrae]|uniref:hypothetical protein n=1 Tax=Methylobacterium nigriterrae TaxID=3127512 RepID=UPI00301346C9